LEQPKLEEAVGLNEGEKLLDLPLNQTSFSHAAHTFYVE